MKRFLLIAVLAVAPVIANAQTATIDDIVDAHILPRFQALANTSSHLATTAQIDCAVTSPALQAAYNEAFDAWIVASHLRFGPTEVDDRAFALAFWPDSRGATHQRGHAVSLMTAPADQVRQLDSYVGSIAYSEDGSSIAVTSPNVISNYDFLVSFAEKD